jgi:hypothetical protein
MSDSQHRTLVLSFSHTAADPRVLRQIEWLTMAGSQVSTIGIGSFSSPQCKDHFSINIPPIWLRVVSYLLFRGRIRFLVLISLFNKEIEHFQKRTKTFDLVIFNDIELSPWANLFSSNPKTQLHLDLHEYFLDQGIGTYWKILFSRYSKWLIAQAKNVNWSTISTVAPSIAVLYESYFSRDSIFVILSAPSYSNCEVVPTDEARIKLIHHGVADLDRGIIQLIESVQNLEKRFELHLMLMGTSKVIRKIERVIAVNRLENRVFLHPPVSTNEIVKSINKYDLEIIFFPPKSLNLLHSLPNKYFEAIQARIGVVHGPSINMSLLSKEHGFSIEVPTWDYQDLALTLNRLSSAEIYEKKMRAAESSELYCAEVEARKFLAHLCLEHLETDEIK